MSTDSKILSCLLGQIMSQAELLYAYDLLSSCMGFIERSSEINGLGCHFFNINKVDDINRSFEGQMVLILSELLPVFIKHKKPLPHLILSHLKNIMMTNKEMEKGIKPLLIALDDVLKGDFCFTDDKEKEAYEYIYFRQKLFFLFCYDRRLTIVSEIFEIKEELGKLFNYHKSEEVIKKKWLKTYGVTPAEIARRKPFTVAGFIKIYNDLFEKYEGYLVTKSDSKNLMRLNELRLVVSKDYDIKKSHFYLKRYKSVNHESYFKMASSDDYQKKINKKILGDFYGYFCE